MKRILKSSILTFSKLKAKEDPELERKTGEWIEDVLGRAIEDPSDLWKSLKDGVVLCEYVFLLFLFFLFLPFCFLFCFSPPL